jgi:hypothetical protein
MSYAEMLKMFKWSYKISIVRNHFKTILPEMYFTFI